MDTDLVARLADSRPHWSIVMVVPVVKIDPAALPQRSNIAWLGGKSYEELPAYLSGWDVALMPFAINEATRFISPTKTPEYLAGGCPVVSTPITDVIRHYGDMEAVRIADTADRSEEHTSTPVTNAHLVCRLLLEKKTHNKYTKPKRNNQYKKMQQTNESHID